MEASASLDPSDDNTFPSGYEFRWWTALPFVRHDAVTLQAMSDAEVRDYEAECFHRLAVTTDPTERDACIHGLADSLVEHGTRHTGATK